MVKRFRYSIIQYNQQDNNQFCLQLSFRKKKINIPIPNLRVHPKTIEPLTLLSNSQPKYPTVFKRSMFFFNSFSNIHNGKVRNNYTYHRIAVDILDKCAELKMNNKNNDKLCL